MADSIGWDSGLGSENGIKIILPDGSIIEKIGAVSAQHVKDVVRAANIKKFNIKNGDGRLLIASDFPLLNGNIVIEEYNEAK